MRRGGQNPRGGPPWGPGSLAPRGRRRDVGGMPKHRPSQDRLIASIPVPMRVMLGLGLLGLCAWLPAAIALFR